MVLFAVFVKSACDVAVTVTEDGRPVATVGAVYIAVPSPVDEIVPAVLGKMVQLTAVCDALLTVAVKACVDEGHPSPASFGHRLAALGVTATPTGWLPLPLLPQAMKKPSKASVGHSPEMAQTFDRFLPIRPTTTTLAIGNVNGNHGGRLSARLLRCTLLPPSPPPFGPEVVRLSVTTVGGDPCTPKETCDGLKTQLVVSSSPEQENVTVEPKTVAGATGATVNE
jgi:hypothetical protein